LLAGQTEIKLGNLRPTRDFVYVKDTVQRFIEIAKSDKTIGEEINIATQKEISVGELASELIAQILPQAHIVTENERLRPEKSEVDRLLGSNEKIMRITNWRPRYDLKQGLAETIAWFRVPENLSRYKPNFYNM
jgi:dTDP-glucose 4,6-dehydratase